MSDASTALGVSGNSVFFTTASPFVDFVACQPVAQTRLGGLVCTVPCTAGEPFEAVALE